MISFALVDSGVFRNVFNPIALKPHKLSLICPHYFLSGASRTLINLLWLPLKFETS